MTYALYTLEKLETFEHQTNLDQWDQSDTEVTSFLINDDARIGSNSAKLIRDNTTNVAQIVRYLEKEKDLTDYTNLFISYKTTLALTHSGSEGFGIGDGINIDWFYPNTSFANTWEFCKKTLTMPDNDNGADLTAITEYYYENNNASSEIYFDFVCIAEELISFNTTNRRVGRAAKVSYPQDTATITSQNSGGATVHLGHGLKTIDLQILLKDTTHWTDLCTLIEAKNKGTVLLLETDFWISPVLIISVDFTSKTKNIIQNSEGNFYIINIRMREYLGD